MSTGTLDDFMTVARGNAAPDIRDTFPADAGNPDAPFAGMFRAMFGSLLVATPADVEHAQKHAAYPRNFARQCPALQRGRK